jgi:hypothetical protein
MVCPQDFRDFPKGSTAAATKFGPTPKFGFKNHLPFFNLPQTVSASPPTKLGIRSVSATLPYCIRKTRYASLAYCPTPPHTIRLISGRCIGKIMSGNLFLVES